MWGGVKDCLISLLLPLSDMDWFDHQSDSVGQFLYFYVRLIPTANKLGERFAVWS